MEVRAVKEAMAGHYRFPSVENCSSGEQRRSETVVADLDGTLVRGRSSFPYFFLVAFEAGGYFRALRLLVMAPVVWFLYHFVDEASGIKLMIWLTFAGLPVKDIKAVASAVLTKFYAEDLHPETWRVFSSFGRRYVLTANPRIMVEPFVKTVLGADEVIGSEIEVDEQGRATGFLCKPGVLVGEHKEKALKQAFGPERPHLGLGDRVTDFPFMALCKDAYIVPATKVEAVKRQDLPNPIIFHDGRLVNLPTPGHALLVLMWMPLAFVISVIRVMVGKVVPMKYMRMAYMVLGVHIVVKGSPPPPPSEGDSGRLFVCNHRTLLDPIILAVSLGRPIATVTYSISRVSAILSPIPTVELCRDRAKDAAQMRQLLEKGELTLCPEGTTCREPFLLRFSALFAELSDRIVPVSMVNKMTMFHGTTARGNKAMDPFFAYMNPRPVYEVTFLDELPRELMVAGGKSSIEVANYIQRLLANSLGFQCTDFTRKDKYRLLTGTDGTVPTKKPAAKQQ